MDYSALPIEEQRRIEKLFERAAHIGSQDHLDKILQSFPEHYRPQLVDDIQNHLPAHLKKEQS